MMGCAAYIEICIHDAAIMLVQGLLLLCIMMEFIINFILVGIKVEE